MPRKQQPNRRLIYDLSDFQSKVYEILMENNNVMPINIPNQILRNYFKQYSKRFLDFESAAQDLAFMYSNEIDSEPLLIETIYL